MTRGSGAGFAGASAALSVMGAFAVQRWRRVATLVLDMEVDAETAAVRERIRDDEARLHRHALTNAVTAVEGATLLLERGTLTTSERESLQQMVGTGVNRLRTLVAEEENSVPAQVCLTDLATRMAEDPLWCQRIRLELPPDLLASGSPGQTTEALRQLLAYMAGRAPLTAIVVRGELDAGWAVLWVEGQAPALSGRQRRCVVNAGRRPSRGTEMPLHMASRLIRGQGGQLRIACRPGGGASFGLGLPVAGTGG